ncbi:adenylate/guanylate cyclase domain-containing protein [Rhizobium rhododendri]|uniref:Adenylate/guanylate cyclase domain-containing protein n=1 Tax=Rhizobium rhododendri TaxID=2506430 RepID=A0ABY8IN39_9HYPH|nr:adenylate/guanylate cyclase domain-containing protein [Rhizobium rhododendri]WFS24746.1 adenylate/guanylate cyclase domain-containing protein [Rhizobium rhododendri]
METIAARHTLLSDRSIRRARLGSGLVVFLFVLMHISNHALGLISVHVAEKGRLIFLLIWRNPIGTGLFYGAVVIHVLLVFRALYLRRTLRMPVGEAFQIITGLLVPLLLIDHVVATRVVYSLYGFADTYHSTVRSLWVNSPYVGMRQAIALVVVWVHGCIGLHFWLRYRPWYSRLAPALLAFAILLPVLGLLGFAAMGRNIAYQIAHEVPNGYPGGYYGAREAASVAGSAPRGVSEALAPYRLALYGILAVSIIGLFLLRARRRWSERAHQITIRYPGGETIEVPRGFTVLEASRLGGIPHYSICGGKGQCSTCRVQVLEGGKNLPPPDSLEQKTLTRIGAAPEVRLACQLRPPHNVTVVPMLVPLAETAIPAFSQAASPGREREIVVLFCDIRHFTTLTESRLPFDIVFLLNRYFSIVGRVIEEQGGRIDKFIGDGVMALFGLGTTPEIACRQALKAAAAIVVELDKLAAELADELSAPLQIAIGIHTGRAVVGSMGYGNVKSLTAIGDTVNVASRLESAAKEFETALVFSEPVALLSGVDTAGIESREIAVRGRAQPLQVYIVPKSECRRFA